MTYAEKLRHPNWQKVRLDIMNRDKWCCIKCGDSNSSLQVHHKIYIKGRDPWQYNFTDLETLCFRCHEKEHGIKPKDSYTHHVETLVGKIVAKEEPEVIVCINQQIDVLQKELITQKDDSIIEEILKNIMFLQAKKKELLTK